MLDGKDSRGGFIDSRAETPRIYHATPEGIYSWPSGDAEKMEIVSVGEGGAGADKGGGGRGWWTEDREHGGQRGKWTGDRC